MSIIPLENWSVRPDGLLNAWVRHETHAVLQTLMPQWHTGRHNWGSSLAGRVIYFEYTLLLFFPDVQPCPAVDGWSFTRKTTDEAGPEHPDADVTTFTLAFNQRRQNPHYPVASREELLYMLGEIGEFKT